MKTLRVKLIHDPASTGRGIGFYGEHLTTALSKNKSLKLTSTHPQLIHHLFFDLFSPTLSLSPSIPTVVTIHDVTPLVLGSQYPKGIRARVGLARQILALRSVSAIITDSENSKTDIARYLHLPLSKIHAIHLAIDPLYQRAPTTKQISQVKQKYQLPERFILYVGGLNPNKNLPRLIKASLNLKVPLIFVGSEFTKPPTTTLSLKSKLGLQRTHPELLDYYLINQALQDNPSLRALGFVSSSDLNAIYHLASVYCQPSLYEGFGLPLLEAMTAGTLIVSSNTSSLPEIYPNQYPLVFDPTSINQITSKLKQALNLASSKRTTLINQTKKKAETFSWQVTANQTFNLYQSLVRPNK